MSLIKQICLSNIILLTDYAPYTLIAKGRAPLDDNDWLMLDLIQGWGRFNEVQQKIRKA